MILPEDIELYVQNNFAEQDHEIVISLLKNSKFHDGKAPDHRILRCALVSSGNALNKLRYQIEQVAFDYREVILDGEYVRKKGDFVQVRDLSKPFN